MGHAVEVGFDGKEVFHINFRMTKTEFDRLVNLLKDHGVSRSARKPQAPAAWQVGPLVHRLAHGSSVGLLKQAFGVAGELCFLLWFSIMTSKVAVSDLL